MDERTEREILIGLEDALLEILDVVKERLPDPNAPSLDPIRQRQEADPIGRAVADAMRRPPDFPVIDRRR